MDFSGRFILMSTAISGSDLLRHLKIIYGERGRCDGEYTGKIFLVIRSVFIHLDVKPSSRPSRICRGEDLYQFYGDGICLGPGRNFYDGQPEGRTSQKSG